MISENLLASCGATRCHITCVSENPCSNSSGGPLPPVRAKMRPADVLIHSGPKPGKRGARYGMGGSPRRPLATGAGKDAAGGRVDPFGAEAGKEVGEIRHVASPRAATRQLQTLFV